MSVVFVHSHHGSPPPIFANLEMAGRIQILRDGELDSDQITNAHGIITTMHLDQVGFAIQRDAIAAFFRNGGRLFFNGHILKPFATGLEVYRPLLSQRLSDFRLRGLAGHPIFDGFDPKQMETRKGVAGFYGRGYNPMPKGARAITGIGTLGQPIDWEWAPPGGGAMFSHAGNDLWSMAPENSDGSAAFACRIVQWAAGELDGVAL